MNKEIKLDTVLVGSIRGEFVVPSYQRGYRWGKDEEVTRLLEDIYENGSNSYRLQPVVVKKREDGKYELIDGQQRLTTIYLIYRYMNDASAGFIDEPKFTIEYETREQSREFLKSIDKSKKDDNIDFFYMCDAYEAIEKWFGAKEKKSTLTNFNKYFDENVEIIWYEVDKDTDGIELFTRLNIGKIPLTSAELVKAIFLSRTNVDDSIHGRQEEISLQWDNIERELQKDDFWYFLTNDEKSEYLTRIDLILNLISKKPEDSKDKYYTFFYFDKMRKERRLDDIWRDIQSTFLILKDWFENHELYHKIGYLIASESESLQDLFDLAQNKTKQEFIKNLDDRIKKSIEIDRSYSDLSYENNKDYFYISRLLLLFNVEEVRAHGENTEWFPFDQFKFRENGKVKWSLEHIHAQQSKNLQKQEEWREWLNRHIESIACLPGDNTDLLSRMEKYRDKKTLTYDEFETIQEEVTKALSPDENVGYLHSIANLALLNMADNAALSNSTFAAKRNEIIKMDRNGEYIPFCTRMVFLKYYTPSSKTQVYFWGQDDRIAYINAINTRLKDYLNEEIHIEVGEK